MIKALILAHHFPPDNVVAARRSYAYAIYLKKFGIEPTILTFLHEKEYISNDKWKFKIHKTGTPVKYESKPEYEVYRVPLIKTKRQRLYNVITRNSKLKVLINMLLTPFGIYSPDILNLETRYDEFLNSHLKSTKYDVIIGVYSPSIGLKLAAKYGLKYQTPYILDFRDLWDNKIMNVAYQPAFPKRIRNYFIKRSFSKWLANSSFFSITSEPWRRKMAEITKTPGHVIENGYSHLNTTPFKTNAKFTIRSVGTIYPEQDLSIFINGYRNFLKKWKPKVLLEFIGIKNRIHPDFERLISVVPKQYVQVSGTKDQHTALKLINNSDLLYFPAFDSIKGWCSVKLYEYLASGRPILVSPGDCDVVDEKIHKSRAGQIMNTSNEVTEFLSSAYGKWANGEDLFIDRDIKFIKHHSRENQVRNLSLEISGIFNNKINSNVQS
ncbi:MAG: hypothetical protein RJQ09_08780 [Cyclobacteriaceae bacterium]